MNEVLLPAVPRIGTLYRTALCRAVRGPSGGAAGTPAELVRLPELPERRHRVDGVRASGPLLRNFATLTGSATDGALPSGLVHVLAFPVALSVMTAPDFPLQLPGMVHLRNSVEHLRRIGAQEHLAVTAWTENQVRHRSGWQLDLVAEAAAGGAVVWRGRSTYLARVARPAPAAAGPASASPAGAADATSAGPGIGCQPFAPPMPTAMWRLDGGIGRHYAAVSGDYNPIHLSVVTARVHGLKRPVAHGMYLASRLLAQALPAGVEAFGWTVDFKSPVYIPGSVAVAVSEHRNHGGQGAGQHGTWRETSVTGWTPGRSRPHFNARLRPIPGR